MRHPVPFLHLRRNFSVNLRKGVAAAAGHEGPDNAVSAPGVLEFVSFGVPTGVPVATSAECAN